MTTNVIYRGGAAQNCPIQDEGVAAAALTPGSLLFKISGQFTPHATDGAGAGVKLYLCDLNTLLQGDTSKTFASGDTAIAFEPRPAERYNALIASGQNITALDTPLASNGDGTLRIGVVGTDDIICYADEVKNFTSAGLGAVKF